MAQRLWSHGMVTLLRLVRGTVASGVLLFVVTAGAPETCLMAIATAAAAGAEDPHACCKAGLSATPPSCCHANPSSSSAVEMKISAGPASFFKPLHADVFETNLLVRSAGAAASPAHSHSPPPILRI
jgi:hypothetical protein